MATLYLYRFVPSKSFTKVIGIRDDSYVLEVLGRLIKGEKFPSSEKISILASLSGQENSKISVKKIMLCAIDRINMIEFLIERGKNDNYELGTLNHISNEDKVKLRNEVLKSFSVNSFSMLCKAIQRDSLINERSASEKFEESFLNGLRRENKTQDLINDVKYSFDKLKSIGSVLNSL